MLGFNGGLIGKPKQITGISRATGVWTANEQSMLRQSGLWSSDPNWSSVKLLLQPTVGGSIVDLSESKRVLTVNGDTQIGTGMGSPALLFDGSGDNIQVANSNDFDANQAFTLELDFIISSTANMVFFARSGSSSAWSTTDGLYYLVLIDSGILYWMWNNNGANTQLMTTAPSVGVLHSFIVCSDGTTTSAWLNGSRIGTSTAAYTQVTTRDLIYLGKHPTVTSYDLNGSIRRFRWTAGIARYSGASISIPVYPFLT